MMSVWYHRTLRKDRVATVFKRISVDWIMRSSLAAAKIDAVVIGMELSDDIKMQWQGSCTAQCELGDGAATEM